MEEHPGTASSPSHHATADLIEQVERALSEANLAAKTAKDAIDSANAARSGLESQRTEIINSASEIGNILNEIATTREKIANEQANIATKSEHIQGALEHSSQVRALIDEISDAAKQSQASIAETLADIESKRALAAQALSETLSSKENSESQLALALQAVESARSAMATAKNLAARADTIEERIAQYEIKLTEIQESCEVQLQTIQGLLPGATAAGLASAFDKRRQSFLLPANRWQWLFVGALGALVLLALSGLWHIYNLGAPLTWDELARLWLARLPIAGALIWLALHASRESALAKRLEEDYGYKAAISASFQGFQKQMAEVGSMAEDGSPLAKLCQDTLTTLADPPGRIYDKHKLVVFPARDIGQAAADAIAKTARGA